MSTPTGADARHPPYPTDPGSFAAPAGAVPPAWWRIPAELRDRPQWLVALPDATGARKVPSGSITKPEQWLPFGVAVTYAARYGCGIGYVLSASDPFTCVDLDVKNAYNAPDAPELWTPHARLDLFARMLYAFDTYAEASQSGQGLHLWCYGSIGKGVKREGVEVYSQERFIACTGNVVLDRPLRERRDFLDNMVSQMRALGTPPVQLVELAALESDYDHYQRKAGSAAGPKFRALWGGAWRELCYPSQSEADMALIRMLCFNNPSNEQVRRMFRLSALGQRKKAARVDYVDGMIAAARGADAHRAAQLASAWVGGGPPPVPTRPGL